MHNHSNDNETKNTKTTTSFLLLAATIFVSTGVLGLPLATTITSTSLLQPAQAQSFIETGADFVVEPKAPVVVSGDNIYIIWWTTNTSENGNEEVMFRASTDGGATFGDKINLSNTTDADSWRVEIDAEGETVVVSWWETAITNQTNQTNQTGTTDGGAAPQDIPVMRVSNDGGATFGPMLMLGMNGTIGAIEEEGEGEVTTATFGEE